MVFLADDDIGIDFSKLFSRGKNKENHAVEGKSQEKPVHHSTQEHSSIQTSASSANNSLDLKGAWLKTRSFTQKNYVWLILLVLLAIQFAPNHGFFPCNGAVYCPWGAVWTRMQASTMPIADDWAGSAVTNNIRNQIQDMLNQQYPNLPSDRKAQLLEQEWTKYKSTNGDQLAAQIKQLGTQFRAFYQYESAGKNFVYMPDIDPYYYVRYARNLIDKGRIGDVIKDGKQWDTHMLAPVGIEVPKNILPQMLAWWHKIAKIGGLDLLQSGASFPVAAILLSLIPAYFVGRKLGGVVGGIAAASAIGISTAIFSRTTWGHPDTDVFNIFFPLMIVWLFIEAIDAHKSKPRWIYTVLTGFAVGLYSTAWSGWWYIFDFLLAAMAVYVIYEFIVDRRLRNVFVHKEFKTILEHPAMKIVRIGVVLVLVSMICVSAFQGFSVFLNATSKPFAFMQIKSATRETLWPNVFTTVAELNPGSANGIISNVTGWENHARFALFLSALGLVWFAYAHRKRPERMTYSILILIWLCAAFYASLKGIRFTELMGPAYALGLAALAGMLHNTLAPLLKKIRIPSLVTGIFVLVLFSLVVLPQAQSAFYSSHGDIPIVNDGWANTLTKIRQASAPDAIINSWWDYGHHFKFFADRAVTFDGASQSKPQAHWIGKVLLTSNEDEAIGILRMLDCGANGAADALDAVAQNIPRVVQILRKIILQDEASARKTLADEHIPDDVAQQVMRLSKCNPPDNYFITSDDMIGKSGVWAHFGSWDFDKAWMWASLRKKSRDEAIGALATTGKSHDDAGVLYDEAQSITSEEDANAWIAPWPGFIGSSLTACSQQESMIRCGNGLLFNTSNHEARMVSDKGVGIPQVVAYVNERDEFVRQEYANATVGVGVAVFNHPYIGLASIAMSPELASSMFTRLYFFQGQGLTHFQQFNLERFLGGGWVSVWKVNWAGGAPLNAVTAPTPKTSGTIQVNYILSLDNGTIADSSIVDWQHKNITNTSRFEDFETHPFKFELGKSQVIQGFEAVASALPVGKETSTVIPPEFGYGTDPSKHPLGNKTLHFRIQRVT